MILALGFIVVSEKNYLDLPQKSILCHSEKSLSEYAKSYCWIHGTSYVRQVILVNKVVIVTNIVIAMPPTLSSRQLNHILTVRCCCYTERKFLVS